MIRITSSHLEAHGLDLGTVTDNANRVFVGYISLDARDDLVGTTKSFYISFISSFKQ
jgi:hypothetical protein